MVLLEAISAPLLSLYSIVTDAGFTIPKVFLAVAPELLYTFANIKSVALYY